jgi:hypothetical protein
MLLIVFSSFKFKSKKLLDFYQRYSVSSYVTCFSYKPLIDEKTLFEIDLDQNSNHVIKCPSSYCEKLSSHSEFTDIIEYSNFLTDEESLHEYLFFMIFFYLFL